MCCRGHLQSLLLRRRQRRRSRPVLLAKWKHSQERTATLQAAAGWHQACRRSVQRPRPQLPLWPQRQATDGVYRLILLIQWQPQPQQLPQQVAVEVF